jgi:hypothetical protein
VTAAIAKETVVRKILICIYHVLIVENVSCTYEPCQSFDSLNCRSLIINQMK